MRKIMRRLPVTKKLRLTEIYRRMFDVLCTSNSLSVQQVLKNLHERGNALVRMDVREGCYNTTERGRVFGRADCFNHKISLVGP